MGQWNLADVAFRGSLVGLHDVTSKGKLHIQICKGVSNWTFGQYALVDVVFQGALVGHMM